LPTNSVAGDYDYPGPDSERHSISDRNVYTGALLITKIHGYFLGLKSIKALIVGLQKNLNYLQ
jgi:hypothetical protein